MTIINVPCFFFIYDPFNKLLTCNTIEVKEGTSVISNYEDVGMNCFISDTAQKCADKITELVLTPAIQQSV